MFSFTGTEALLFKKKFLVISDLHIGIEYELYKKGINIPSQTNYLIKKIKNIKEKTNAEYLIINGDLKHNIPKTSYEEFNEIPYFIFEISSIFKKIYIIKGNHDGDLEELIPLDINNVKILKSLKIGNVVFTHGNYKPKLIGKYYVIGHHHFAKNILTSIGETIYEKVFVVGYGDENIVIILPAFTDLSGYWDIGQFHGPISKLIKKYEVYTLDGILIEKNNI